jgi:hypothetical protein
MNAGWIDELRRRMSEHGPRHAAEWLGVPLFDTPLGRITTRPTMKLLCGELTSPLVDDARIVALVTRVRRLAAAQIAFVVVTCAALFLFD